MVTLKGLELDQRLSQILHRELERQRRKLEMIASENFASEAVLAAGASVFTNKYAEGYPERRYYGGCEYADELEVLTHQRVKKIFGCEYVNVQPHSGSSANMAAYFAVLKPGDSILGMDLSHGGHLTHGAAVSFSGRLFSCHSYGVSKETELIDYDRLIELATTIKPKVIVAGASSYPRIIDFQKFREAADLCGAVLIVDMAHFAGLVAAGIHPSPVPYAEIVTSTTHKTLRGPRGGLILCRLSQAKAIDEQVFPGLQGGPLMHIVAAKCAAMGEALQPDFIDYQHQTVKNAQRLAARLSSVGYRLVSGGTDTHLILVDLRGSGLNGQQAQTALDLAGITANKNMVPFEKESFKAPSGLRLGTAALTTRGFKESDIDQVSRFIIDALDHHDDESKLKKIAQKVEDFTINFPLYPGMDS